MPSNTAAACGSHILQACLVGTRSVRQLVLKRLLQQPTHLLPPELLLLLLAPG
jgi:hypothetical protein